MIAVIDLAPPEAFVHCNSRHSPGRPQQSRTAIARAFIAKAVYNLSTTRALIDRVQNDPVLRRLCGWETVRQIPSEATFSRSFAAFAEHRIPERIHEALIKVAYADTCVGHISRDATAIKGRETSKTVKASARKAVKPKRKPGRPRKGEEVIKAPTRLQKQRVSDLDTMLADLPVHCDVGKKKNSKGFSESWKGYKLHIDAADGEVPISCILTSASMHDSQAAIPLSVMSGERIDHLYELMDAAYDSKDIAEHSRSSGHVPIIDVNPRNNKDLLEGPGLPANQGQPAAVMDGDMMQGLAEKSVPGQVVVGPDQRIPAPLRLHAAHEVNLDLTKRNIRYYEVAVRRPPGISTPTVWRLAIPMPGKS